MWSQIGPKASPPSVSAHCLFLAAMTTSDETPDSFTSAWSKANFTPDNRAFVERFTNEIGISSYEFVDASYRYIRATRRDKTGELRIY